LIETNFTLSPNLINSIN